MGPESSANGLLEHNWHWQWVLKGIRQDIPSSSSSIYPSISNWPVTKWIFVLVLAMKKKKKK
jgi:hypothetical protein